VGATSLVESEVDFVTGVGHFCDDVCSVWGFPPDTFGVPCSELKHSLCFCIILIQLTTTYLQQGLVKKMNN
jgi:hypothetical protein